MQKMYKTDVLLLFFSLSDPQHTLSTNSYLKFQSKWLASVNAYKTPTRKAKVNGWFTLWGPHMVRKLAIQTRFAVE